MATLLYIKNAFDPNTPYVYTITGRVSVQTISSTNFELFSGPSTDTVGTTPLLAGTLLATWTPFNLSTQITLGHSRLFLQVTGGPGGQESVDIQNLKIIRYVKANVQDSDMRWAGRRTSYYEGTKISAPDFNIDSADTVDGGPVVQVTTVNPNSVSGIPREFRNVNNASPGATQ